MPSNKMQKPSNKMQMPSNKMHMPSNKVHMPSDKMQKPSNKMHMLSNKLQMPSNKLQMPSNKLHMPSNKLHMPSDKRYKPTQSSREATYNKLILRVKLNRNTIRVETTDCTQHTPMCIGRLLSFQQSLRPHFLCRYCDRKFARRPPKPIASVVTKHAKKRKRQRT